MHDNALPDNTELSRDLDPNVLQRRASDPDASVWVSASAGTGKTKVLTDRVLRLLLPRANGAPGTAPHKILGITFTKAAASEMALRISKRLGNWAIMPQEKLEDDLKQLLNRTPNATDINAARKIFSTVIDTPGGLKIMTIHAFCQSILGRFPLEARLPPYFSVLEEPQAAELLKTASRTVIEKTRTDKSSPLSQAFSNLAATINEEQFIRLIGDIISERRQLNDLLKQYFNADGIYTALCKALDVQPGQSEDNVRNAACQDSAFAMEDLKRACVALSDGNENDQTKAETLGQWINASPSRRAAMLTTYTGLFLTKENTITTRLGTKAAQKNLPELKDIMITEGQRLLNLQDTLNAQKCAGLTTDLIRVGTAILKEYETIKTREAALDFDDLILKTCGLIKDRNEQKTSGASWVLYKLDHGLDHILVDEAQDTNPDQWAIIEALCAEFFAGKTASDTTRTVFVVGDEKQSIYSFQRASPEEFSRMQDDFREKVQNAHQTWSPVDLNISFRSTKSVLQAVDAVFSSPEMRKGLSRKDIQHLPFRTGHAGRVELWPLFETGDKQDIDLWKPPVDIIDNPSGQAQLAEYLADTIAGWIKNRTELPSKGRPITAGDIMILVRTRTPFVHAISRALKAHTIPVSGADRMVLNDQLVIQDLLAIANFALLPDDDLTLACILKSPVIDMDENTLMGLASTRTDTLWTTLQNSEHTTTTAYLTRLIQDARRLKPFEFFSEILQTPCPADKISGLRAIKKRLGTDAIDPVQELLRTAIDYERNYTPALQNFILWQSRREDQIKREMEEAGGQVRIMTVHGSKGLQAPIVIMPDTTRTVKNPPGQIDKRLIWPDKSAMALPIWSPRKDMDCEAYRQQAEKLDERQDEEYRRLLYVAMTRAEDRLYITGYTGRKKPLESSWYNFVRTGLSALPETQEIEGNILRLDNPQIKDFKPHSGTEKPTGQNANMPEWLTKPAPTEPDPPAPLRPSRPSESQSAVSSPLAGQNTYRFRRGNVTHKLLEVLPDIAENNRPAAAEQFLSQFAVDLPQNVRTEILNETLDILHNSDFSPLFGAGSRAEVPISGHMPDGRIISGQIDRLLITETDIWVIDYKSNRPSPTRVEDIPPIYQNQLQAYADTLRIIYPNRTIHAALLWTDKPELMRVPVKSV